MGPPLCTLQDQNLAVATWRTSLFGAGDGFPATGSHPVVLLALHPPLGPPIRQPPPHSLRGLDRVEGFGVESPAGPPQHVLVLLMVLVTDGLDELLVAPGAAH